MKRKICPLMTSRYRCAFSSSWKATIKSSMRIYADNWLLATYFSHGGQFFIVISNSIGYVRPDSFQIIFDHSYWTTNFVTCYYRLSPTLSSSVYSMVHANEIWVYKNLHLQNSYLPWQSHQFSFFGFNL